MGLWTIEFFWGVIPWFLFFASFAFLLRLLLKDNEKAKIWILRGIAITILALEVGKQVASIIRGYDLYHLPFHYCSLFLLVLPFHAFSFGKFKKYVDGISFATLTSLFFVYMVVPTVLYPKENFSEYFTNFFSFHTITFHHLVVLYLFLAIAFGSFNLKIKRDFPICAIFLSTFVIISTSASYAHNENYHNLLESNVALIKDNIQDPLNKALGWGGQAIYIALIFVFTTVIALLAYFLISLFYKYVAKGKATVK